MECQSPQRNSLLFKNTQSLSAQLERTYLQDPRHCDCFIDNIQAPQKRNIALEQKYKEQNALCEGHATNNLMGMLTVRVTAGVLTGAGHHIASKEFLELQETKNEKKECARQKVKNNKYDKDIKMFTEGMDAMKKSECMKR